MLEALKLIISHTSNPHVADQAMTCIRALNAKSPIVQMRYQQVVQMALANDTDWTPSERAIIAEPLEATEESGRSFMLRVRLTENERAELQSKADAASTSISEYVRQRLFTVGG